MLGRPPVTPTAPERKWGRSEVWVPRTHSNPKSAKPEPHSDPDFGPNQEGSFSGSVKGQAARWPFPRSRRGGGASAQAARAMGQRVRKTHPEGGARGDGGSPPSTAPAASPLDGRVRDRGGRDEGPGVGMARGPDEVSGGSRLHHPAEIEHHDPVADVLHHGEIVGDEDERDAEVAPEVAKQVDDLRLHAHVEGRDRLVADHQARLHDEGAGDADALALAARELVRIAVELPGEEAHPLHHRGDPGPHLVPPEPRLVGDERLGDDLPRGHPGVERGEGVLEDHLDVAAIAMALPRRHREQVLAAPERLPPGPGHRADERPGQGRLARAALPDDAEGLARPEVEAHPANRS